MRKQLLIATRNKGKVEELSVLLKGINVQCLSLDEVLPDLEIAETGESFRENAIIKAAAYADASGLLTIADESGLEVDALGGKPGVRTARYGGADLTPKERYELLLKALVDVPWEMRTARFRCVVAVARPHKLLGTSEGVCEGLIALSPRGEHGFGYDPVFLLPDRDLTMAELNADQKHLISHRGRAIKQILPLLERLIVDEL